MKVFVFLIFTILAGCATGPISSGVATSIIANQIDKSTDKLTASIDRAIINSDYLLEKNLRSLDLIAQSLVNQVQEELGVNREFASRELVSLANKFSSLIDQAEGGLLEIEDFLVLDIQNFINQIPFKDDEIIIRRFIGYSQKYQSAGQYEFTVIGNAFAPGKKYGITVNGKELDNKLIYGGAAANTLRFSIPTSDLNDHFNDVSVNRVSVNVTVKSNKKTTSVYDGDILLLPKYPIKYRITETKKSFEWSGENGTQECKRNLGPSGSNGVWTQGPMECVVSDPEEKRFTRMISHFTSGSHSRVDGINFTENNTVASSTCHNQCHNCPRSCTWILGVEEKVYGYSDHNLLLQPLSLDSQSPREIEGAHLVSFGTYSTVLSDNYSTFTLAVEYFNGQNYVLHPQKIKDKSISAHIDSDDTNNSSFKRLIVEINNPFS